MWTNIIGQERVIKILKNIYSSNKISHSYIFYGKEGTGKDAVAIEFAKLINCDNRINGTDACDTCASCRQINSLNSTTFKFISALPSGRKETAEDDNPVNTLKQEDYDTYLDEIEKKSKDNYHKINIPNANDIKIGSIRQIKKEIYLTGIKGKKKIFLISNSDLMNTQSSNAFLKILEEPPGDSLIILTTSRLNAMLSTITGRCQKIRFDPLKKEELTKFLLEFKSDLKLSEAELYADISDGSILKCKSITDSYFFELREKMIEMLIALVTNKSITLSNIISSIISEKDKEKIRQFLLLLIIWFRDVILVSNGETANIINKDKAERLDKFSKLYKTNNYKIINYIEDTYKELDQNLNTELLLINLALKIKSEFKILQ
jgi:DNA polymerase III subunit delta'